MNLPPETEGGNLAVKTRRLVWGDKNVEGGVGSYFWPCQLSSFCGGDFAVLFDLII